MRMDGLDLAQGALAGVFQQVSSLLAPLYDAIRAHCVSAGLWQAGETSWKVFEEVESNASNRWWLWAFASLRYGSLCHGSFAKAPPYPRGSSA